MVGTVRVARGLTQSQVANKAGISQAVLSKVEGGALELDRERIESLARVLEVPVELLLMPTSEVGPAPYVFHRKRSTLPVSKANQLRAELDLVHLQVEGILGSARPPVLIKRSPLLDDGYVTPADVANELRKELSVGRGPIENLVGVLESAGVVVVERDLGSTRIDAVVSWPEGRSPLVLLGSHAPADRQRFTMAHELAHAVMHQVPTEDQESEADRFASEFLMPTATISSVLEGATVPRLAKLKPEWGVSMAALLRRARDLGRITESQYKQINIEFSKAGYRTREPVELPREKPSIIRRTIDDRLAAGESIQSIAQSALMTDTQFRHVYRGEAA
jgi:Zn-dependent peptidase ImmA (M78 family)/transcriptional regulator with XRE-family HTH domain